MPKKDIFPVFLLLSWFFSTINPTQSGGAWILRDYICTIFHMGGTRIFESSLFLVKHLPLGPTSERQAKRNGQVCRDVSSASIATSMFFFRPFGYHVAEQKPCNRQ